MLKTMDDLERAINNLLQRLQGESPTAPASEESLPESGDRQGEAKDHEAAELIRRAIKRLKSIWFAKSLNPDLENNMPGRVDVEIFGKVYTVRGDKDPEYVRRVAEFVDRKMREISQVTETVSTSRIAILASLNIADELISLLEESEQLKSRMNELTQRIESTLDGGW
jgi:cell division protein ZapA